jgi:hypothetical protein
MGQESTGSWLNYGNLHPRGRSVSKGGCLFVTALGRSDVGLAGAVKAAERAATGGAKAARPTRGSDQGEEGSRAVEGLMGLLALCLLIMGLASVAFALLVAVRRRPQCAVPKT